MARTESALLASRGVRSTRGRRAVLRVLERERGRQLSAQEVHRRVRRIDPRVGLTTVYRTLSLLHREGILDVVSSDGREQAYRLCTPRHHHHLVCSSCGAVVELAECDVASVQKSLERTYGFRISEHSLSFRGLCRACAR
jgi:Fur family ferric uptake transcriptional regulator